MSEFWTRFLFENGKRMSSREIKKVMGLEEEILDCLILISYFEEIIREKMEEINCIKNGGEQKQEKVDFEEGNTF